MELDKETLQKYTNRSGIDFDVILPAEEAVIVLLPNTKRLEEVYELNMPTAIIAGDINDDIKDAALEVGYDEEAIIVKEREEFKTLSGKVLFKGKNIPLGKVVELAKYIFDNDIVPEIIVWKPEEVKEAKSTRPSQKDKEVREKPIEKSPAKRPSEKEEVVFKEPVRNIPPVKPRASAVTNLPLSDIADRASLNIYIIKTVRDSESGLIAHAISQKLDALHLDITGEPFNDLYGADKLTALATKQYGYSPDGINVEIIERQLGVVVYEIDADFLDGSLLQRLYDKSQQIYQIPSSFDSSADPIKSWLNAGFRLDGIIVTEDVRDFKQEWPDLTLTIKEVLEKV